MRALRLRAPALVAWGAALLAGAVLAFLIALDGDPLPGDLAATRAVQDWPVPGQTAAEVVRTLTATESVAVAGAVLALVAWLAGRRRSALAFALGLALVILLQTLLKDLVDRPRPAPDLVDLRATFTSPSFPAGHVMTPTYALGFLAVALASRARVALAALLVIALAFAGLANVFVGVHWPSDVIGGYLWAIAVLIPAVAYTQARGD